MKYLKLFENINFDDIDEEEFDETIFEVGDVVEINKENTKFEKIDIYQKNYSPNNYTILDYYKFKDQLGSSRPLKVVKISVRYDGKQIIKLYNRPDLWYLSNNFVKI